jgi:hypothetical protein
MRLEVSLGESGLGQKLPFRAAPIAVDRCRTRRQFGMPTFRDRPLAVTATVCTPTERVCNPLPNPLRRRWCPPSRRSYARVARRSFFKDCQFFVGLVLKRPLAFAVATQVSHFGL